MKCDHCKRPFRSKAHYVLHQRRLSILSELNGGPPAEHLMPIDEPHVPKLERHRYDAFAFHARGDAN